MVKNRLNTLWQSRWRPALAAALLCLALSIWGTAAWPALGQSEPTEPPDAPTGLSGTAEGSSVSLTWDDPADDSITG